MQTPAMPFPAALAPLLIYPRWENPPHLFTLSSFQLFGLCTAAHRLPATPPCYPALLLMAQPITPTPSRFKLCSSFHSASEQSLFHGRSRGLADTARTPLSVCLSWVGCLYPSGNFQAQVRKREKFLWLWREHVWESSPCIALDDYNTEKIIIVRNISMPGEKVH